MKTICLFSVIATAGFLLPAGDVAVIDDFEREKPTGWGAYRDAESPMPRLSISDETISGDGALRVFFGSRKRYVGISLLQGIRMPENAVALSFLVKPVSGAPPETLTLSERTEANGKDFATAVVWLKTQENDWQKITIPLDSMKYAPASPPELRGKPFPFKPGAFYSLRLNGVVSEQPAVFLIDNLVWEVKP